MSLSSDGSFWFWVTGKYEPDRIEWLGACRFVEMGTTIQFGVDIIVVKKTIQYGTFN